MKSERVKVRVPEGELIRVDKFVASLGLFSRSQISRRQVAVYGLDGLPLKLSGRLKNGDDVVISWNDPEPSELSPEPMELNIVYEDDDCVVIDKAQGVVVHPAPGNYRGTLVQGLLHRFAGLETAFGGDKTRPGIVHRLDKDTSGLIIAAKSPEIHEFLSDQFRERQVEKIYLALTRGVPRSPSGEIDAPIGRDPRHRKKFAVHVRNSKSALTRYKVLHREAEYAALQVRILTGRTHQVRVHLKSIGCSIIGDRTYSRADARFPDATLMLHAWKLKINLPRGGLKAFTAEIPQRFRDAAAVLGLHLPDENQAR